MDPINNTDGSNPTLPLVGNESSGDSSSNGVSSMLQVAAGDSSNLPQVPPNGTFYPSQQPQQQPMAAPIQSLDFTKAQDPQQQQLLWQQAIQALAAGGTSFALPQPQTTTSHLPPLPTQQQVGTTTIPPQLNGQQQVFSMLQPPQQMNHLNLANLTQLQQFYQAPVAPKRKTQQTKTTKSKRQKAEPSIISSSSHFSRTDSSPPPPSSKSDLDVERMTPAERRRHERNLREQQRSYRISQQIKTLRDLLTKSNVPYKPNKFSILMSVADYIKQLQSRAIMLDAEHQKLIDTIRTTNETVSQLPSSFGEESEGGGKGTSSPLSDFCAPTSSDLLYVQGLDYEGIFRHCPFAMGVASLDGRILGCNASFEELLGCDKETMMASSLFVYIRNHQDIFEAMADLLKRSCAATETGEGTVEEPHLLYWCGHVVTPMDRQLSFNITLTNTADGNPKYFSFSAAEVGN